MLNNNIKILLVSFVHHIELQNFLNTPRICTYVALLFLYLLHQHSVNNCNFSQLIYILWSDKF